MLKLNKKLVLRCMNKQLYSNPARSYLAKETYIAVSSHVDILLLFFFFFVHFLRLLFLLFPAVKTQLRFTAPHSIKPLI